MLKSHWLKKISVLMLPLFVATFSVCAVPFMANADDTVVSLPRTGWVATAYQCPYEPLSNAIDNDVTTHWPSGEGVCSTDNEWFQVNMGSVQDFNCVAITSNATDFPDTYVVSVSTDGTNFTQVASVAGQADTTVINFDKQSAQYIKVVPQGAAKSAWWSIYDFDVRQVNMETILPHDGWTATAYKAPADPVQNGIDGNPDTHWTNCEGVDSTDNEWYQVDFGKQLTFNCVKIQNNPNDYPDTYLVFVSNDGQTFEQVTSAPGTSGTTYIVLPTAQTAQYIKLVAQGQAKSAWWTICELDVIQNYTAPSSSAVSSEAASSEVSSEVSSAPVSSAPASVVCPQDPNATVYELENGTIVPEDGHTGTNTDHSGYSGSGFACLFNSDTITVTAPADGTYSYWINYGNGNGAERDLTFVVNGDTDNSSVVAFPATANWDTWGFVNGTVTLKKGDNTIEIVGGIGSEEANINMDYFALDTTTTAPVSSEVSSAPASSEVSSAPASSEVSSTPASSEVSSAPASSEVSSAPTSSEVSSAPASSEVSSALASSEVSSAPVSSEASSAVSSAASSSSKASSSKVSSAASSSEVSSEDENTSSYSAVIGDDSSSTSSSASSSTETVPNTGSSMNLSLIGALMILSCASVVAIKKHVK